MPLRLKSYIVPAVNFGSRLSFPVLVGGLIFSLPKLVSIGLMLFSLTLIFQLITLPVEFDASKRALRVLEESNILMADELPGARSMLKSAALTYVAATITTALQFLRLIILFGNRSDRRN